MTTFAPERSPTTPACRAAWRRLLADPNDAGLRLAASAEADLCGRPRLAAALRYAALNHCLLTTSHTFWERLRNNDLVDGMTEIFASRVENEMFYGTVAKAFQRLQGALEHMGLMPREDTP